MIRFTLALGVAVYKYYWACDPQSYSQYNFHTIAFQTQILRESHGSRITVLRSRYEPPKVVKHISFKLYIRQATVLLTNQLINDNARLIYKQRKQ